MPLVRPAERCADVPGASPQHQSASPAALLDALHAESPRERRSAARRLAMHAPSAPALCAQLCTEPEASVRSVILTSLITQRSHDVVKGLLPYLRSEDAWLRNSAIEALQTMPDVLEPFIDALIADGDSDVRILAVNLAASVPHGQAPRWLERVARDDCHVNVCAAAVEGLAEIGDEAAIPALASLSDRFPGEPYVAFAAGVAIRRIRGR
jgi:HEAT repeat protein